MKQPTFHVRQKQKHNSRCILRVKCSGVCEAHEDEFCPYSICLHQKCFIVNSWKKRYEKKFGKVYRPEFIPLF